ncbi:tetratricopeptide repeat protein [Radicibacter daui]|uniref:tetratricopeptide repeat protein n=1 Tax=Radicibacter daui TaxID=3064829 RepID=UPI004046E774
MIFRTLTTLLAGAGLAALSATGAAASAVQQAAPSASSQFLIARAAQEQGDWGLAAQYYRGAVAAVPDNATLRQTAILALLMSGQFKEAVVLGGAAETEPLLGFVRYAEALKGEKYKAAADFLAPAASMPIGRELAAGLGAIALRQAGDKAGEQKQLAVLGANATQSPLRAYAEALIADMRGDGAAAVTAYQHANSGSPSVRITEGLISAALRKGDKAAANAAFAALKEAQRSNPLVEDLDPAHQSAKPAPMVANPRDAAGEWLYSLAVISRQQSPELAEVMVRLALDLRPDFPLASVLLGELVVDRGRPDLAVPVFKLAVDGAMKQRGPESGLHRAARLELADALYDSGSHQEGLDALSKLTEQRPNDAALLLQLGNLERREKNDKAADAAYTRAEAAFTMTGHVPWRLYYLRAMARFNLGDWQGCEKDLLTAFNMQSDDPYLLNFLGYSWIERGENLDRAKGMIEKAVSLKPDDGFITDSLGWAEFQMGSYADAVRHLEHAVTLEPVDSTINDHLGDAYWRVGRKTEARYQWERAAEEEKDADKATAIRAKLTDGLKPL